MRCRRRAPVVDKQRLEGGGTEVKPDKHAQLGATTGSFVERRLDADAV